MTTFYNDAKNSILNGDIDLIVDDIQVLLLSHDIDYVGSNTADAIADHGPMVADVVDDVIATEFTDAAYGRVSLGAKTISTDDAGNLANFNAENTDFGAIDNDTINSAILFKQITDDTDSPVIYHITAAEFPLATNGQGFTLQWSGGVVLNLS